MRRVLLALLALTLPQPAFADPMARVVSPAAGAELTAGSFAVIEWEGLALPERTEEWEAFLSVDGGRTWPLRITPHLDVSIRRFSFRVPHLPTREARLLLRFGDERQEVEMAAPQRFAIAAPAAYPVVWAPPPIRVLARGERARAGDEGVIAWVEGDRSGEELREVVASDPEASLEGVHPAGLLVLPLAAPISSKESLPPPAAAPDLAPKPVLRAAGEDREPRPARVSVRLLTRRFNE
jgi:hypothetical protein